MKKNKRFKVIASILIVTITVLIVSPAEFKENLKKLIRNTFIASAVKDEEKSITALGQFQSDINTEKEELSKAIEAKDVDSCREAVEKIIDIINTKDEEIQKEFAKSEEVVEEANYEEAKVRLEDIKSKYNNILASKEKLESALANNNINNYSTLLQDESIFNKEKSNNYTLGEALPKSNEVNLCEATEELNNQQILSAYPISYEDGDEDEFLKETLETKITDEIKNKAEEIGSNPLELYKYVRNNINYEQYAGSRKGAIGTFEQLAGNDYDQSSLLISLLRNQGISARYVTGIVQIDIKDAMSWTGADTPEIAAKILASMGNPTTSIVYGGEIVAIKTEHVWVEAFCDVGEYRGLGDETNAKMWIPLDPSFKRCNKIQGSINEDKEECYPESYYDISLLEEEDELGKIYKYNKFDEPMDELKDKLTEYLNNKSSEGKRVIDVIGGLEIIQEDIQVLPFSLPNKVVSINNKSSEISNDKKEKISISLIDEYGLKGELYLNTTATELYGKKLTLSWLPNSEEDEKIIEKYGNILNTPAYLIEVKPVIKADGEIISTGTSIGYGEIQNFSIKLGRIGLSSSTINATLIAGGYYALGLDYGSITENELNKCISNVNAVKDKVNTSNYYTDEVVGELVNGVVKTYFAKLDGINKITSEMYDVEDVRSLSFGISGLKPRVQYTFNTPVDISLESMYVDIGGDAHTIVSRSGHEYLEKIYMINTGTIASSMESMVIEEVTGLPAVSTISIMEQAKNEGQKIYDINKENINEILPLLNVDSYIKDEITNAVNGGNTVTIPESEVNYYDWTGSVYIVSDPNTGSSGYMISGGLAGGESSTEVDLGEAFEYFLIGLVEGAGSAIPFIAISLLAPFAPTIITLIVDVIALILFVDFIKSTAEELFQLYHMYEEGLISKQQACNALAEIIGMVAGGMAVGWAARKFVKSSNYKKIVTDNIRSYCKECGIKESLGEKIYAKGKRYEFKQALEAAVKGKEAGLTDGELDLAIENLSVKNFRKYCETMKTIFDDGYELPDAFKKVSMLWAKRGYVESDTFLDKVQSIANEMSKIKKQIKDGVKDIFKSDKVKIYDFGEKIAYTFENSDIPFEDSKALIIDKSEITNWSDFEKGANEAGAKVSIKNMFSTEIIDGIIEGKYTVVDDGNTIYVKEENKVIGKVSISEIDIINNSDKWMKSLSEEEIQSLYKYQSNDIYERLNTGLRNGKIDYDLIEIVKNLDSAIAKGKINGEVELYRGFTKEDIIENWDEICNGMEFEFVDDGYISTSLKPSVADNFSMLYDGEGIFAYIKVADVNAANISAISSGIDESEILLERGLNCKITKAWEEDGYKYVIMEVSK